MNLDDSALFYADYAVPVTHQPLVGNWLTAPALFDQPGTTIIGGEILATDYSLRFPVVTFPSVKRGDKFLIGSTTYTARENAQPASIDGLEFIVPLVQGVRA